ncbi:MAG: aminotransferase class V-fold PLP-dependent enzyme [Betaproteobacteria bacterium]|nr:aminotransferase class V-fold PLP-dependent enzyme [Betaproteobacteria bacterium]MCC6247415.1 aminotransferase class V-fold PLP-dependent enzyme [Rubrivivax sp.]
MHPSQARGSSATATSSAVNPRIPGIRSLHSPGPTRVPDAVMHAMQRPMMDLMDPRVGALIAACEDGMRTLLGSAEAEVLFYAANGHGMWECVTANLCAPGRSLLIAGGGHFSDSWAMQTEILGRATGTTVLRTPLAEGHPTDPAAIEQVLRDDKAHRIAAVLAVHTDTASGITSDLAAIRRAIDAAGHPALYVVDLVASLGAAPFEMDALRVDVAMGASQKGLMCPPGLGYVAVNARALAFAEAHAGPRFYWDWVRRASDLQYKKFCGTPPLAHLAGLHAALQLIAEEGLANVHARHARLGGAVHAALARWSEAGALRPYCRVPAARSSSVTAIECISGDKAHDPEALRTVARERFQVAIAGGLGPLAGRVFRIGHLGDMNEATILGALAGVEAAMTVQGIPYGAGGVAAAVASLVEGTGAG